MPSFFSMSNYPELALYLALVLIHEHFLFPKLGRLMEMSREYDISILTSRSTLTTDLIFRGHLSLFWWNIDTTYQNKH